ncbi:hypothetical protein FCOIX_3229 [Fusarium coicis]|nr:hypothetical protein FCOIX_3229 [Fusarium coicis]
MTSHCLGDAGRWGGSSQEGKAPSNGTPDEFTEDIQGLVTEAQATPQKRRRALKEDDDELEESSIWDSEAPELVALFPVTRKLSWLVGALGSLKASQGV